MNKLILDGKEIELSDVAAASFRKFLAGHLTDADTALTTVMTMAVTLMIFVRASVTAEFAAIMTSINQKEV